MAPRSSPRPLAAFLAAFTLLISGASWDPAAGTDLGQVTVTGVVPVASREVLLVDLDGDGDGDLMAATGRQVLRIFLNEGGAYAPAPGALDPAEVEGRGFLLAAADPDRDGDADVAVCGSFKGSRGLSRECRLFLNRLEETGDLRFERAAGFPRVPGLRLPLFADPDGDLDLDLLLLDATGSQRDLGRRRVVGDGRGPARQGTVERFTGHVLMRNDWDGSSIFAQAPPGTIPGGGAVTAAAVLDRDGRGEQIHLSRPAGPDQLLVWNAGTERYEDVAAARLPGRSRPGSRSAAAADFNGDGERDLLLIRAGRIRYLQEENGRYVDRTAAADLEEAGSAYLHVVAADFDRDRREDFVVSGPGTIGLLINQGDPAGAGAPAFADRSGDAGLRRDASGGLAVHLQPETCDFSVHLLAAPATRRSKAVVYRFPDDSPGRTVPAIAGVPFTEAPFDGACVEGSDEDDRLLGHARTSILRGGAGDDTLVAQGGLTVMEGGPGVDRFEATGYTIIRLPEGDIAPGETIVCDPTRPARIDSPLARDEMLEAGVVFKGCFEEAFCPEPPAEATAASFVEGDGGGGLPGESGGDEAFECHGPISRLVFSNSSLPLFHLQRNSLIRNLVPFYDGSGVGRCDPQKVGDCARYGLELCLEVDGLHQCYPNIEQWCDDPFFARNRADETLGGLMTNGERFVLPMVIWLPRSAEIPLDGACDRGQAGAKTLSDWNTSLRKAMNTARSVFGQWGIEIDYRVRIFIVPETSGFVDPAEPACTDIVYSDKDPAYDPNRLNSVKDLVTAYPGRYIDGEINVYLTDQGRPHGESYGFSWSSGNEEISRKFILLHNGIGAITHELSHELGLGHPWDLNLARAGGSDTAESRDSWSYRPFPDQPTGGLNLCVSHSECDGFDAEPGICVTAPGAASGYCYNLKVNCATKGDRVCDTPWDTAPCFQVGHRLGQVCLTDQDCMVDGGFRGLSFETTCGFNGRCIKRNCTDGSNCASGLCVKGTCANLFGAASQSCCDLHDDIEPGSVHNICMEWITDTKGPTVLTPAVGTTAPWPLARNAMTYHGPGGGVPKTFTRGQRDKVICRLSYAQEYGRIRRRARRDGFPCSLRSGSTVFTYGGPNEGNLLAHGACDSGVCEVSQASFSPTAVCVASTCADRVVGKNESDADCGGTCRIQFGKLCDFSPVLGVSQGCRIPGDCLSGICTDGRCYPSCSDLRRNGAELGIDEGGSGFEATCGGRDLGETCRFADDCAPPGACVGTQDCVSSAECPVNDPYGAACTQDSDCPGGLCRTASSVLCNTTSCTQDSDCRSGFCNTQAARCHCSRDSDCPMDSCNITAGVCVNECVDGRCLGECQVFSPF